MNLWDFIQVKMSTFLVPDFSVLASAGRPTGRPHSEVGRPGGRPTCTDLCMSGSTVVGRPDGRPLQRVLLSVCSGRPGGRPVASTKDLKSSFRASTVFGPSQEGFK